METKINWGIIGAGAIAKAFANALKQSATGYLAAVGSRSQERAEAFAAKWDVPTAYGSYEDLLTDDSVQAVYIATPHTFHVEWAVKAANAGKHLLVEKPMGINQYEAQIIQNAAASNGVFLMEAYMYRCHPQTTKLVELLAQKVIGDIRVIQATFSFQSSYEPDSRLWSNALAGGGILDVGGYTTSICRLIAGTALGKPFADPLSVDGAGSLHPESSVDQWAVATLKFEGGIVATCATGIGVSQENVVRIFGSEGNILLPDPYVMKRHGEQPGKIIMRRNGQDTEEIEIPSNITSFAHEVDVCGRAILAGDTQAPPPAMTWADSLGNLRTQDMWRAAIGLQYDREKPENATTLTATHIPLRKSDTASMPLGKIAKLDKAISRLIMGVDNQITWPHASAVYDDYFERGGNAFDTAHIYGKLKSQLFGQWINARKVRNEIVIIAKGAHTPDCYPDAIVKQLDEQLCWLGVESADIYMLHRDNPDVPVGEFVEALNQQMQAGRFQLFGGSNWTLERVQAANEYARSKGLQGFTVISNNLSLAEMINPVWAGCVHVHSTASRKWLAQHQIALLPWSSQARGFFLPERARPGLTADEELVRCWYSEDNFKRQARAIELAKAKGVEPINIALAWVLSQDFPTFPLIGPRQISETRSSIAALNVTLTTAERRYLNLED
jgi:predicted dehydrogenase/aryl-alcohol dehydrogenase-like predicted oxidoreductase